MLLGFYLLLVPLSPSVDLHSLLKLHLEALLAQ
jgi:hypothetical protein